MGTFLCTRTSRPVSLSHMRIATTMFGGMRTNILSNSLMLQQGMLVLEAQGVSCGAFYNLAASGFSWWSNDGLVTVYNLTDFSGGNLIDSGLGEGTLVRELPQSDPTFCTVYLKDTAVSG